MLIDQQMTIAVGALAAASMKAQGMLMLQTQEESASAKPCSRPCHS